MLYKSQHAHTYTCTHAHTLDALPFTQNRGKAVTLTLIPQERYWVWDFWALQSQVTPKDTWYQKTFYKLGFEVCQLRRWSLCALETGRGQTSHSTNKNCTLVLGFIQKPAFWLHNTVLRLATFSGKKKHPSRDPSRFSWRLRAVAWLLKWDRKVNAWGSKRRSKSQDCIFRRDPCSHPCRGRVNHCWMVCWADCASFTPTAAFLHQQQLGQRTHSIATECN